MECTDVYHIEDQYGVHVVSIWDHVCTIQHTYGMHMGYPYGMYRCIQYGLPVHVASIWGHKYSICIPYAYNMVQCVYLMGCMRCTYWLPIWGVAMCTIWLFNMVSMWHAYGIICITYAHNIVLRVCYMG